MGSVANPIFATQNPSLALGLNPTGNQTAVPGGSGSVANPYALPSTSNANAMPANPYGVVPTSASVTSGTAVPGAFPANSGPYTSSSLTGGPGGGSTNTALGGSPIGSMSGMTQSELKSMLAELSKTYGSGTAGAIMNFLMGGAGFNQQAVNNLFASLQPGIERGEEDLMSQFSASGNRFSSGSQIGMGDFLSQVNLNEGQIETQMYETAINDYMNTLLGVAGQNATRISNSPSTFDDILSGLQLGGSAAGAASSAGVGGTAGSILDVLAGMA